jgi:hypothetical protein
MPQWCLDTDCVNALHLPNRHLDGSVAFDGCAGLYDRLD